MSAILWIILFVSALLAAAILSRGQPHLFAALAIVLALMSGLLYFAIVLLVPELAYIR